MIYLDNAATSYPKPQTVYDSFNYYMTEVGASPGRSGYKTAIDVNREIYNTRKKIRTLIGADLVEEIVFTSNCTESLNLAIEGILNKGDHVITTVLEHNSVLRPLNYLRETDYIELSIVDMDENFEITVESIEKEIRPNTRLIVINHMSNVIGKITDITSIGNLCKKKDITFLVDAAQSIGREVIDVNKMNIDLLAFPGHKGLFGPQGTGGLYIRRGIDLRPLKYGGTGSFSESIYQPENLPDKYESGTLNGPGIIALGRGVDYVLKEFSSINEKERELTDYFIKNLRSMDGVEIYGHTDGKNWGSVISINIINKGSSEVAYILDDYDIGVRSGLHCAPLVHESIGTLESGTVRFSPGIYNTRDEIEYVLSIIEKISKS